MRAVATSRRTVVRRAAAALFALWLTAAATAAGQNIPWTRARGMAGADFVLTRGIQAVELNPANLAAMDSTSFAFGTAVHGGRLRIVGAGVRDLADIVTAAGAGDAGLLEHVPAEGLRIHASSEGITARKIANVLDLPDPSGVRSPTLGLAYGGVGLVLRSQTVADALVSRELVDLALNGFNPERIKDYAAKGTGVRSFTFTSATLGMGRKLGRVWAGLGLRYVHGRKLLNGRLFEPEVDVENERIFAVAAAVESRGGNGFGVDAGLTYEVSDRLTAAVSVQNLWQRMHWSEQLYSTQSTLNQDDLGGVSIRDLIGRFKPRPLDPSATTLESYAAAAGLFTESFFPRVARAGLGWIGRGGTEVQLSAAKTLGAGALTPVGTDRLAAGVEKPLGVLRLRTGLAWEEGHGRQLGFGLGLVLGNFTFDTAGGWTSGFGASAGVLQGFSASVGFGLSFTGSQLP